MRIGIVKERRDHERRVAATPETVKRYKAMGLEPLVERGAGIAAAIVDEAYEGAGARLVDGPEEALACDILLKVQ